MIGLKKIQYFLFFSICLFAEEVRTTVSISGREYSVCVPSELQSKVPGTYSLKNLFDGNISTAWVEGQSGIGVNESIIISSKESEIFEGIVIFPGYTKNVTSFVNNCVPSKIEVSLDEMIIGNYTLNYRVSFSEDSERESGCYPIADTINLSPKIIIFKEPAKGKKLKLTIRDVYNGKKYPDMAISELMPIVNGSIDKRFQTIIENTVALRSDCAIKNSRFEDLNAKVILWDPDKGWTVTDTGKIKTFAHNVTFYKRIENSLLSNAQLWCKIFNDQFKNQAFSVVESGKNTIVLGGVDYRNGDGEWIELYPVIRMSASEINFYELSHIDGAPGCHDVIPQGEISK